MALLTLKDIGKIYVSEGNVTVGIRGVNLSFERGEFVAVTGKSGSGKSTLLNVISGMDSYEEGEIFIEGQPTSHYFEPDWERYRSEYISFIFQDYNIIESFTVLENVELALMHIDDKKARRARAIELLTRVGLKDRLHQKGSKLSGGQKQRTVIARALAKDSPIILADEPTGNLDSKTSAEIIKLLREVSKDKLLIVVTHNFDQVQDYATRHIRIFDGAVESDQVFEKPSAQADELQPRKRKERKKQAKAQLKKDIKNGLLLGKSIFAAKPKLSAFLCLLLIVGTIGIFLVTSAFGVTREMVDTPYMFEHIEGRVVLTTDTGAPPTEEELETLKTKYGAEDYLRCDMLLDSDFSRYFSAYDEKNKEALTVPVQCTYRKNYGENIIGRYPTAANEVLLYLPIGVQPVFGKSSIQIKQIFLSNVRLNVVGLKYFYDNNLKAEALLSRDGFKTATSSTYLTMNGRPWISVYVYSYYLDEENVWQDRGTRMEKYYYGFVPAFDLEDGKMYGFGIDYERFEEEVLAGNGPQEPEKNRLGTNVTITVSNYKYDYYTDERTGVSVTKEYEDAMSVTAPELVPENMQVILGGYTSVSNPFDQLLYISPTVINELADELVGLAYKQSSLFFKTDDAARAAAKKLNDAGYVAVASDTTYSPDPSEIVLQMLAFIALFLVWLLTISFLAFFIHLCSSRAVDAFKGDMAIMRSMGISVNVIRIGMYARMLVALIPAYILMVASACVIFLTPTINPFFTYLYWWQYALIFVGVLLLSVLITRRQIKKLFNESVKKSLKGGNGE